MADKFNPQTSTHLPNGAEIKLRSIINNELVVLCYWEGRTAPWVTWRADLKGNASWGRYFREESAAIENYKERCQHVLNLSSLFGGKVYSSVLS